MSWMVDDVVMGKRVGTTERRRRRDEQVEYHYQWIHSSKQKSRNVLSVTRLQVKYQKK